MGTKTFYSLDERDFTKEKPEFFEKGYIVEGYCDEVDEPVLILFSEGYEPMHLHNEDGYAIVLEYFREESENFLFYLDYTAIDNPHYLPTIITHKLW